MVERGIADAGSTAVMLTYGDAHLEMLDDDEIRSVVRACVEQAADRAIVVAATGLWSTRRSVDYARFCRDVGAAAVQVTYALRWGAYDGNDVVAHHRAIAEVLPVQLFGHSTPDVQAALVDEPNVFGIKTESAADTSAFVGRFGERYDVMGGGSHWLHQMLWGLGVRSWMTLWCSVRPDLAREYRAAFEGGRLADALELVTRYEIPLFHVSETFPAGIEATWRGALELLGIAPRYRRAPLLSLTDAEMERLHTELTRLQILA